MAKRQILLLSSSKVHGYEFLEYAAKDINDLLHRNKVSTIWFIPYALSNHEDYLKKVEKPFNQWGYKVDGIHNQEHPVHAVEKSEAIFVGGGNTFRLLKTLYDLNLIQAIRKIVLNDGVPYIGSSAGTNVATKSINTTNDMPIVYPPSFEALRLVPFNINPHYLDPEPNSKHKGETREERILQYHEEKECYTVLGLREGSTLYIEGNNAILKGLRGARLFVKLDELALKHGHRVLRLPPYHCHFNPIEMVWSECKRYYDAKISSIHPVTNDVALILWNEALEKVTPEKWKNYVKHATGIINDVWEREKFIDAADTLPIVINLDESDLSDDDYPGEN